MERLGSPDQDARLRAARILCGRFLQALAIAKGDPIAALAFAESQGHWADRGQVVAALKAIVTPLGAADFPAALNPIAEAFLAAMRPYSIPLQLTNLRKVPMRTRLYLNSAGAYGAEVAEGDPIPIVRGTWDETTLLPRRFCGVVVQTEELARSTSPTALLGFIDDLAQSVTEPENRKLISPYESASILNGASNFAATGSTIAEVVADLRELVNRVPGAFRDGAAFLMSMETAAFLATLYGTGGAPAFPGIGPQGGVLLGLPVIISNACAEPGSPPTRVVALVNPGEVFWADEGKVILSWSNNAALQMDDSPAGGPTNLVSMFQSGSTALKAIRESAWYPRPGAGAYYIAGY